MASTSSSSSTVSVGLWVKEGRALAKGVRTDNTRWNAVTVAGSVYTVERAPQLQAKINLDEIVFTPAFDKHPNKEKCYMCKMYFERKSVDKLVPHHRMLALQRKWNVVLEGRRYQSGSFMYASSHVCKFCAQLFQDVDELPQPKSTRPSTSFEWSNSHSDSMSTATSISPKGDIKRGFGTPSKTAMQLGSSLDAPSVLSLTPSSSHDRGSSIDAFPSSPNGRKTLSRGLSTTPALTTASMLFNDIRESENGERLNIQTVLSRSDMAPGNRTYQSSTVDNMHAELAITHPYTKHTRTRREVDPWWELDFSRRHHVDSVSLKVLTGHSAKLYVSVLLLSKPTGFEDPFLDSVIPRCVAWKEFILPENAAPKLEEVMWVVPPGSICAAVRVQIRGICTLSINQFQVFFGDSFIEERETDIELTANSYASMSLSMLKEARAAMITPQQKRERLRLAQAQANLRSQKRATRDELETRLVSLSQHIASRFSRLDDWKSHVLSYLTEFEPGFIVELFHHVFVPAVQEGIRSGIAKNNLPRFSPLLAASTREVESGRTSRQRSAGKALEDLGEKSHAMDGENDANEHDGFGGMDEPDGTFLTDDGTHTSSPSREHNGAGHKSREDRERAVDQAPQSITETLVYGLADSDLEDGALLSHYPRCELSDLHTRIRSLLIQISSRNNLKSIGSLGTDEHLAIIADEASDYMQGLLKEFKSIDNEWQHRFDESRDAGGAIRKGKKDPSEDRGVSWSQFVIIFRMFYTKQLKCMRLAIIPASVSAAKITVNKQSAKDDLHSSSLANLSPHASTMQAPGSASGTQKASYSPMKDKSSSHGASTSGQKPLGGPLLLASPHDAPLLFGVRDPAIPVLDTRFSEYKLSNFIRKTSSEMVREYPSLYRALTSSLPHHLPLHLALHSQPFPRTLTLDFTQKMLEFQKSKARRPAQSEIQTIGTEADDDSLPSISLKAGSSGPSSAASPASPVPVALSALEKMLGLDKSSNCMQNQGADEHSHDDVGAARTCALCSHTFPRNATAMQVLWKHVIRIRRRWDPDGTLHLLPKDLAQLEQGTSMFNLVHVCGFCHQFFDPDFEGGIAFPSQQKKKVVAKLGVAGLPPADTPATDGFFDDRYPIRESNFFQDRSLLESRARAKRLLDLLSAQKEQEETL